MKERINKGMLVSFFKCCYSSILRYKKRIASLFILLSFNSNFALASYYNKCVYPTDLVDSNISLHIVKVPTLDQDCEDQCQADCTKTFSFVNAHGETSNDYIQECVSTCKNGSSYSNKVRMQSNSFPLWKFSSDNSTVKSTCVQIPRSGNKQTITKSSNGYYVADYDSNGHIKDFYFVVDPNISFDTSKGTQSFSVSFDNALTNKGYQCGSASSYIYPMINSAGQIGLVNQGSWTSSTADKCPSSTNYWNVQNYGAQIIPDVTPKDGDYLSLSFIGNYGICHSCTTIDRSEKNMNLYYGNSLITSQIAVNSRGSYWPNTKMVTLKGQDMSVPSCASNGSCGACNDSTQCLNNATNVSSTSILGMNGSYTVSSRKINNASQDFNIVTFAGQLTGFSSIPQMLAVQYPDQIKQTEYTTYHCHHDLFGNPYDCKPRYHYTCNNYYLDNNGGVIVKTDWQGCYFNQSTTSLLQYAIKTDADSYGNLSWTDITDLNNGQEISGTGVGNLVFRIKPNSATKSLSDVGGGYNIVVKSYYSPHNNGLTDIVENIDRQLFGTNASNSGVIPSVDNGNGNGSTYQQLGVVQAIFKNIIQQSSFISIVRSLLVLYIAYVGFSFMLGISPISQHEAIKILIKFFIVLALISDTSWDLFNYYVFGFIKNFRDYLISLIAFKNTNTVISPDPTFAMFSTLTDILKGLFSTTVWIKIIALIFSGLTAWIVAALLIIAAVSFIVLILKIVMVYITSLIGLAILTVLAPLFLCFVLFKYTEKMFLGWLKLYISFALQPVMVFLVAVILIDLVKSLFGVAFSFTACSICLLGFGKFCLLPFYMALPSMHAPGPGSIESASDVIEVAIMMCVLMTSGNILFNHISQLATEIATGTASALNLATASINISSPITMMRDSRNFIISSAQFITGSNAEAKNSIVRKGIVSGVSMMNPSTFRKGMESASNMMNSLNTSGGGGSSSKSRGFGKKSSPGTKKNKFDKIMKSDKAQKLKTLLKNKELHNKAINKLSSFRLSPKSDLKAHNKIKSNTDKIRNMRKDIVLDKRDIKADINLMKNELREEYRSIKDQISAVKSDIRQNRVDKSEASMELKMLEKEASHIKNRIKDLNDQKAKLFKGQEENSALEQEALKKQELEMKELINSLMLDAGDRDIANAIREELVNELVAEREKSVKEDRDELLEVISNINQMEVEDELMAVSDVTAEKLLLAMQIHENEFLKAIIDEDVMQYIQVKQNELAEVLRDKGYSMAGEDESVKKLADAMGDYLNSYPENKESFLRSIDRMIDKDISQLKDLPTQDSLHEDAKKGAEKISVDGLLNSVDKISARSSENIGRNGADGSAEINLDRVKKYLELSKDSTASKQEVEIAYKKAMLDIHPDQISKKYADKLSDEELGPLNKLYYDVNKVHEDYKYNIDNSVLQEFKEEHRDVANNVKTEGSRIDKLLDSVDKVTASSSEEIGGNGSNNATKINLDRVKKYLELSKDDTASEQELRTAYKKAMLDIHPDKINQKYGKLSDEKMTQLKEIAIDIRNLKDDYENK